MHDISNLEAQWKRYKSKQKKPLYVFFLVFFTIVGTFFLFNSMDFNGAKLNFNFPKFDTSRVSNVKSSESKSNGTLVNAGLTKLDANTETTRNKIELSIESEDTLVDIPILDLNGGEENTKVHRSKNKNIKFEIIETSSISAYRDVEERFLKSHDIDDAFFLAKSYFNKGDYEKSGYWALETNKLDETHEESLLIFAESKVKLGKRSEGISILQRYIGKTNSEPAKDLLYKIQDSRF